MKTAITYCRWIPQLADIGTANAPSGIDVAVEIFAEPRTRGMLKCFCVFQYRLEIIYDEKCRIRNWKNQIRVECMCNIAQTHFTYAKR